MKSYTDIEQSKKLAEILPLESADMCYVIDYAESNKHGTDHFKLEVDTYGLKVQTRDNIPCWSLAALLSIASTYCNRLEITLRTNKKYNVFAVKGDFVFRSFDKCSDGYDDLVDACVAMIEKLHEFKML